MRIGGAVGLMLMESSGQIVIAVLLSSSEKSLCQGSTSIALFAAFVSAPNMLLCVRHRTAFSLDNLDVPTQPIIGTFGEIVHPAINDLNRTIFEQILAVNQTR